MSDHPLVSSAPAAQGVDASGVQAFLDAVAAAPDIQLHSLMIMRHDRPVAAGWWAPYTAGRQHLLYSLSKSFTSTAAGLAFGDGLLDPDATVLSYFPELDADISDPRSRAMLVRHIAAMASGHTDETLDRARALDPANLVRGFLLVRPDRDPGTVFAYNQPCTYTLGEIVRRVTGQSLTGYLRPRLFDPLGIGPVAWLRDAGTGQELGFSGLHATTDAIARLGLLYLHGGVHDGRPLLPGEWVSQATSLQTANADAMTDVSWPDWKQGYGFQFWMSRHGYRGDGAYGQFCLVLPEHDAVIAITTETENMQAVLDCAWQHLLPAFGAGPLPGQESADAALAQRLASLAIPPAPGQAAPPAQAEAWSAAEFAPEGGRCADQPGLTGLRLSPAAGGWTLTLTDDGKPLELLLGPDGWTTIEQPVPIAVSGGWTDADTLAVELAFLETPHRLLLTATLPDHTFTARWRTFPLHAGPLRTLGAPHGDAG
jgi:CubicO group peptidase (beta-lactamase class C family)